MNASRQSLVCLTTSAAFGGAETSLMTLLGALRALEPSWRIVVVAPGSGPLPDACRAIGVAAVELPYPPALRTLGETGSGTTLAAAKTRFLAQAVRAAATLPQYVTALRRLLREHGATVVHSNGLKAHVAAALGKPSGVRLVWHLHDYVRSRPMSAKLLRRVVHRADALVANSESVRGDAAAAFDAAGRIRRVYNAVDLERFTPQGSALDLASLAGLPPDDGRVRLGLVATFARWKGQEVFIDAISRLRRRPGVRAYIIGGPVYETAGSQWSLAELQERVAAAGLAGTIGFTGHVADVPAALRALDVVVHASTRPEPFGMVIAEGMAAGRAVVAARAGGASELFDDGVDAVAHTPGDARDLAERLGELIENAELRRRLGAAARATACRRFAASRMAAEFREVYLG